MRRGEISGIGRWDGGAFEVVVVCCSSGVGVVMDYSVGIGGVGKKG